MNEFDIFSSFLSSYSKYREKVIYRKALKMRAYYKAMFPIDYVLSTHYKRHNRTNNIDRHKNLRHIRRLIGGGIGHDLCNYFCPTLFVVLNFGRQNAIEELVESESWEI